MLCLVVLDCAQTLLEFHVNQIEIVHVLLEVVVFLNQHRDSAFVSVHLFKLYSNGGLVGFMFRNLGLVEVEFLVQLINKNFEFLDPSRLVSVNDNLSDSLNDGVLPFDKSATDKLRRVPVLRDLVGLVIRGRRGRELRDQVNVRNRYCLQSSLNGYVLRRAHIDVRDGPDLVHGRRGVARWT